MAEPTSTSQAAQAPKPPKTLTYFVNGEEQQTTEHKLTVRAILSNAGFEPAEWLLSRDSDGHEYKHLDHQVELKKDERFTATFTGPTPTT